MPSIKRWGIADTRIFQDLGVSLPKQMANCKFLNLQCLQFDQIKICSIEGLSKVDMPALKIFFLGLSMLNLVWNNVSSWKDLRKAYWPRLNLLNIEINKSNSMKGLAELWVSSKMRMFCVESVKKYQTIYGYSCSAKLQVQKLMDLCSDIVTKQSGARFKDQC